jgi:hypothetical protein
MTQVNIFAKRILKDGSRSSAEDWRRDSMIQGNEDLIGIWEFYIFNEEDAKKAAILLEEHNIKFELEIG